MSDPDRFGLAQWPRSYTRPGPVPLPDRGKAPPIHRAAEKRSSRQLSKARGQEKGRGLIAPALLLTSGSRLSQRGCAAASKASELTKCRGLLLAPGPVVVTLCSLEDFPPERRLTYPDAGSGRLYRPLPCARPSLQPPLLLRRPCAALSPP
jgi:hypothetical protein